MPPPRWDLRKITNGGEPLSRPADLEQQVSDRWAELGLEDLGIDDPDPSLFGYALDRLIQGLKTGQ